MLYCGCRNCSPKVKGCTIRILFAKGDVAFSGITSSWPKAKRHGAYKVEVRFRGPNGDQGRKGALLVRTKKGLEEGEEGWRGVS